MVGSAPLDFNPSRHPEKWRCCTHPPRTRSSASIAPVGPPERRPSRARAVGPSGRSMVGMVRTRSSPWPRPSARRGIARWSRPRRSGCSRGGLDRRGSRVAAIRWDRYAIIQRSGYPRLVTPSARGAASTLKMSERMQPPLIVGDRLPAGQGRGRSRRGPGRGAGPRRHLAGSAIMKRSPGAGRDRAEGRCSRSGP